MPEDRRLPRASRCAAFVGAVALSSTVLVGAAASGAIAATPAGQVPGTRVPAAAIVSRVSITGPARVSMNDTFRITGKVSPAASRAVNLYEFVKNVWVRRSLWHSSAIGTYAFTVHAMPAGGHVWRVIVPATGRCAAVNSAVLTIASFNPAMNTALSGSHTLFVGYNLHAGTYRGTNHYKDYEFYNVNGVFYPVGAGLSVTVAVRNGDEISAGGLTWTFLHY
jgi:hypothetical protein